MDLADKIKQAEALSKYQGEDRIISFDDKRNQLESEPTGWVINSGLSSLDNVVEGFRPGNLVVISGPTSQGKTTVSQTITRNLSVEDVKSLWFPFEGDSRDFLDRLESVTVEGFIPAKLKSNSLIWLEARIKEAIAKYGVKVVFIDHLHCLFDLFSSGNASLSVGSIVRRLKLMAVDLNIVIFLIAHIRKLTAIDSQGNFRKPSIEDLRDSSLIGQEADYVLLLWRKQAQNSRPDNPIWTDKAVVSLQKNRRTGRLINFDVVMKPDRLFDEVRYYQNNQEGAESHVWSS